MATVGASKHFGGSHIGDCRISAVDLGTRSPRGRLRRLCRHFGAGIRREGEFFGRRFRFWLFL